MSLAVHSNIEASLLHPCHQITSRLITNLMKLPLTHYSTPDDRCNANSLENVSWRAAMGIYLGSQYVLQWFQ